MKKSLSDKIALPVSLLSDIRQIIESGKQMAYSAINVSMITTYWNIGRRIVTEEQHGEERAEYGSQQIELLADELTKEFGSGFSARYLRAFRQFYLIIPNFEIWKSRFPNLTWTHIYRSLRVGDETKRRR